MLASKSFLKRYFQEKTGQTEGVAECVAALESVVDIESSCGYLTLVTKTKEDADGEKKKEETKESKASDNKQEIRETSPDGAELNSCNAQLLEEELEDLALSLTLSSCVLVMLGVPR